MGHVSDISSLPTKSYEFDPDKRDSFQPIVLNTYVCKPIVVLMPLLPLVMITYMMIETVTFPEYYALHQLQLGHWQLKDQPIDVLEEKAMCCTVKQPPRPRQLPLLMHSRNKREKPFLNLPYLQCQMVVRVNAWQVLISHHEKRGRDIQISSFHHRYYHYSCSCSFAYPDTFR